MRSDDMTTTTKVSQAPCWEDFELVLASGVDRLLLYGPSGTGKTFAGLTYDVGPGGAYRLVCTPDMTTADIAGCFMPAKEGFEYLEGAGLRAWKGNGRVGGRLVVDEVDQASGDVLAQLLAFTDSPESARFTHPETGEEIRPLSGYSVVLTTNLMDPDDLPQALRDRFPVALKIDRPHVGGLDLLSPDIRPVAESVIGSENGRGFSLRGFYAFDKLRTRMSTEHAARFAFGEGRSEAMLDALRINNLEVGRLDTLISLELNDRAIEGAKLERGHELGRA
jgi:hypothetical protein